MIFRSIRAVLAGLFSIFAVTTAVDLALHAAGFAIIAMAPPCAWFGGRLAEQRRFAARLGT